MEAEAGVSAYFRKMEREQYRSVIRFLFWKGHRAAKSKGARMLRPGLFSLDYDRQKYWFNEFQRCRTPTSILDEPGTGASKTGTT